MAKKDLTEMNNEELLHEVRKELLGHEYELRFTIKGKLDGVYNEGGFYRDGVRLDGIKDLSLIESIAITESLKDLITTLNEFGFQND